MTLVTHAVIRILSWQILNHLMFVLIYVYILTSHNNVINFKYIVATYAIKKCMVQVTVQPFLQTSLTTFILQDVSKNQSKYLTIYSFADINH